MNTCINVLIADDFQILLEDMAEVIRSQPDMEVVGTATSAQEIIALSKINSFDLILMDIEMENTTSGIKAAEMIRDHNKEAKIIFLTAHETKEMILTAMGTGAIDYIVKGIPEEEILHHIRSAYNGKPLMERKIQEIVMSEFKRLQQSEQSLLFFINNVSQLTSTERELIHYLLKGMKVRLIAKERGVEVVTVKTQINKLLKKFGVSRTKEIVNTIIDLKLTHLF